MTAFARPSLLDNRYAVIAETSTYTYDDDDLVNYAEFLRKHGRYMTKGGYVDASRNIRSLHRQQEDFQLPKHQTSPSRSGLLVSIIKSPLSAPITGITTTTTTRKKKRSDENEPSTLSNTANLEMKKREYDKQMKLIEEEMIKAKQKEREAKRLEGDVKKEQRYLQHSLRNLDVDTTKKRYNAERNLSKNLQEKDQIEREFVKKREKQTKERTDHLVDTLQTNKDRDRRNLLFCNDLARQYRTKSYDLQVKHAQLHQVHSDFEQKIQQKESEEARIKKELSDIAMALNLEAQKAKADMKDFLTIVDLERTQTWKQDSEQDLRTKPFDQDRRRLSGDVGLQRSVLEFKQRDALRRIGDTKSRLDTIYAKQRHLNTSTAIMEQDRRATQLMSKMNDIDNRRTQLMSHYLRDKTEKIDDKENETGLKTKANLIAVETKQHEDKLRDLELQVIKNEEAEYELRKAVKETEFLQRKKEQEVQRLREELVRKKRDDAKKVHDAIARCEQEERALERALAKAKTKLFKIETRREDNYARLTKQREQMRENKTIFNIHAREHERLIQIQNQSQSLQSLNTI